MKKYFLALSLLVFSACSKSPSSDIATGSIYASLSVRGDSSGSVECEATLYVGGITGTYIVLSGDDTLTCSDGTTTKTMSKNSGLLGNVSYEVTTGLSYGTDKTYTITFSRGASESHAATFTLPTAVVISSPAASATHQKGSPLTVTWNAQSGATAAASLVWSSGSSSGTAGNAQANDDGSDTLDATQTTTESISGNVTTTLMMDRHLDGSHPSTLDGTSTAIQRAEVVISLID